MTGTAVLFALSLALAVALVWWVAVIAAAFWAFRKFPRKDRGE